MKKIVVTPDVKDANKFCNELNNFYGRFDKYDFSDIRSHMVKVQDERTTSEQHIVITADDVVKSLSAIKIGKSAGPDKINGSLLKLCKYPLSHMICNIFQQSVDRIGIPKMWKTSEIVPKKGRTETKI